MSKHTPGPWALRGEVIPEVYSKSRQAPVARCPRYARCSDETMLANARLIAAAPELKLAVEYLLTKLEERTNGNLMEMDFARKALAKAEGKEE